MTTPDRWRRIEDLCHAALSRPAEDRATFLADACAGDAVVLRDVESLLAQVSRAEGFMSGPAAAVAASAALEHAKGTLVGQRLGCYTIGALLGVGGMGEVYRAHDEGLGRDVAIKVLPLAFTADPQRQARFEREARLLATLNHPNIGAIYGLVEASGGRALVLELVEGETLGERIGVGASSGAPQRSGSPAAGLSMPEVCGLAQQIASALDAAHEKGIVHRDLKPSNIKITRDGVVKVLDFGLAKPASPDSSRPDLTGSRDGVILGTAAYMSPEQARGQDVDKRTDIWAFGCVLYEMLAGRPVFLGETTSDTIAKILEHEPDWSALPAATPQPIRRLLLRCLVKDPKQRLRDIGDVRFDEIEAIKEMSGTAGVRAALWPSAKWLVQPLVPWSLTGALAIAFAVSLAHFVPWKSTPSIEALRLVSDLGGDAPLAPLNVQYGNAVELSPDGRMIAFVAKSNAEAPPQLYIRALNRTRATALAGTEDAISPFFSPDGKWIGFFANTKLKKIASSGGAPIILADALSSRGGTWASDDTIVFQSDNTPGRPLSRVSASGGKVEELTALAQGEATEVWPQILSGGRALIYTSSSVPGAYNDANVVGRSLPDGIPKVIQRGGYHARYLPSGHLIYIHNGTLFAAPFDPERLELRGPAVPALEGVMSNAITGGAQFAVSDNGTLVYLPGQSTGGGIRLEWMDRMGRTTTLRATLANWFTPAFAPDGGRLAMEIRNGPAQGAIWVYEPARDTMTRLTTSSARDSSPTWTPDGLRIAFASDRASGATPNLYWMPADGTGEPDRLTTSKNAQRPASWHPSGRFLAFEEMNPLTMMNIMILPLEREGAGWKAGAAKAFVHSANMDVDPRFSPDGRWLAYASLESPGHPDVFVQPFPGPGARVQVSVGGGAMPVWSRTKPELLYGLDGQIMAVSYSTDGGTFRVSKPRVWSPGRYQTRGEFRMFDLHPDGERVALAPAAESPTRERQDSAVFVFNFFDELRRLSPSQP
jgi:serine/threonine protein kinase/Tol biopolymer transport system component